jgi:hypothetical protein
MPVTIDEVSADVAEPQNRGGGTTQSAEPQPGSPSEQRRQRELIERLAQRAARVCAN